ncbi:MAG TPA: DUF5602 domain-containing protein [Rhodothermales bacterium]|nr:DUF5602 domain-containing protein [Rhodothermales bacterium]
MSYPMKYMLKSMTPVWCLIIALLMFGCDADDDKAETFVGESQALGNGTVQSWVRTDASGNPEAIGVTLTEAALTNLPTQSAGHKAHAMMGEQPLALPDNVQTPFNHISVDWNPQGHEPPGLYDLPHFDFHFYMISEAQRDAINPANTDFEAKAAARPGDALIPAGYIQTPGAVPRMGAHWLDAATPELNGQVFTKTFIYGFFDAKMNFFEPMITKAYLESVRTMSGQAVTTPIPQPQQFAQAGYYPTQYSIRYDAAKKEYTVALEGMTRR